MTKITVFLKLDGDVPGIKEAICNALESLGEIQRVEVSGEDGKPEQLKM